MFDRAIDAFRARQKRLNSPPPSVACKAEGFVHFRGEEKGCVICNPPTPTPSPEGDGIVFFAQPKAEDIAFEVLKWVSKQDQHLAVTLAAREYSLIEAIQAALLPKV